MITVAVYILLVPLAAFVLQIFFGTRLPRRGDWLPTLAICTSLALSIYLLYMMFVHSDPYFIMRASFTWIVFGDSTVSMGILLNNLSIVMLMVVTVVSSGVHLFSIGYMRDDPRYARYFAFLALFSFSMLGIVLADNLLAMYVFWELVGISSYLLIGFWFEKKSASDAGKKAFVVNRVGDIGMFVGILIVFSQVGTFEFEGIFDAIGQGRLSGSLLTIAGICLFCGAIGKSAQFPLHVWLPDAMEGPTPVSALIHAATMVVAGVYLIARIFPMLTPDALLFIAYIGAITLILGATIAVIQTDIKRVLAYSTISQIGYMILSLGVGAYVAAFFHLVTHAAFKACLFLGSGSVIHAVHSQEMSDMGGLKSKMPITFWTFLLSTLAISGIPLTSGFLSKDAILAGTLAFNIDHPQHFILSVLAFGGVGITAFYMFRLVFRTFYGKPNNQEKFDHAHESPRVMTIPLIVLASLTFYFLYTFPSVNPTSVEGGWFAQLIEEPASVAGSAPEGEGHLTLLASANPEAVFTAADDHPAGSIHTAHYPAMGMSILMVMGGILFSYLIYYKQSISAEALGRRFSSIYRVLSHKYYFDEMYDAVVVAGVLTSTRILRWFDMHIIDGFVNLVGRVVVVMSALHGKFDMAVIDGAINGIADLCQHFGRRIRLIQTGRLQNYLVGILVAVIVVLMVKMF